MPNESRRPVGMSIQEVLSRVLLLQDEVSGLFKMLIGEIRSRDEIIARMEKEKKPTEEEVK